MPTSAPAWLRESFKNGVDWQAHERIMQSGAVPAYEGADPRCFLAQFDPKEIPCGGQEGKVFERVHLIPRQRVRNALAALLPTTQEIHQQMWEQWAAGEQGPEWLVGPRKEFIQLAEWDARNGEWGCELHHRRFDNHACSPDAPQIVLQSCELPDHALEMIFDWGLESEAERRFLNFIRY